MSDHILRAITSDGLVQATAISSRDLTERARQIHKTLPVATAALGRTLAGASMMGNALKGHVASLTLQYPTPTATSVATAQPLRRSCPCAPTASWTWVGPWDRRAP